MSRLIVEGGAIATVDDRGTEYANGHLVIDNGWITAVGPGPAARQPGDSVVDAEGCLVTPGLVNTHHHLYQWSTRGLAQCATLFEWLVELYPVWGRLDAEVTHAAAAAGIARLALTGTTTIADHHYVFPADGGDQIGALLSAARLIGPRLHLVRGSMDRGVSRGGLPPDNLVEDTDEALSRTADTIATYHDPAPDARVRVAVGPCSPFSVTHELMVRTAELARAAGVRLHTHLAETVDEQERCHREFGRGPVEFADDLGWLGPDVWLAHAVHLDHDAIARIGATATGVAHCPTSNGRLGSGIAPVRALLDAGAAVGLGADGAASNESGGLAEELHQALLVARLAGGPRSLTARDALWMATAGGARCLGRQDELGSLSPGKLADVAVWRLDGLGHAGIADPVAALVHGPPAPLARLLVGGVTVVADGALCTADERTLARGLRAASERMAAAVSQ